MHIGFYFEARTFHSYADCIHLFFHFVCALAALCALCTVQLNARNYVCMTMIVLWYHFAVARRVTHSTPARRAFCFQSIYTFFLAYSSHPLPLSLPLSPRCCYSLCFQSENKCADRKQQPASRTNWSENKNSYFFLFPSFIEEERRNYCFCSAVIVAAESFFRSSNIRHIFTRIIMAISFANSSNWAKYLWCPLKFKASQIICWAMRLFFSRSMAVSHLGERESGEKWADRARKQIIWTWNRERSRARERESDREWDKEMPQMRLVMILKIVDHTHTRPPLINCHCMIA